MNRRWRREREQRAHTPQSMEASSGCRCSHVISSLLITVGAAARQPPPTTSPPSPLVRLPAAALGGGTVTGPR
jgi:hypothetical protein